MGERVAQERKKIGCDKTPAPEVRCSRPRRAGRMRGTQMDAGSFLVGCPSQTRENEATKLLAW